MIEVFGGRCVVGGGYCCCGGVVFGVCEGVGFGGVGCVVECDVVYGRNGGVRGCESRYGEVLDV